MKHEAARYVSGFDYFSAARNAPSWYCRNSAAKLAASWARLTELAASMAINAKLVVSMAVQAILGAFLAALGNMIMLVRPLALLCRNLAVALICVSTAVCKSAGSCSASRLWPVEREQRTKHEITRHAGGADIAKVKNNTRTRISVAADIRSQDFSKPFTGNLRFLSHLVGG